jgi:hypothetical protein
MRDLSIANIVGVAKIPRIKIIHTLEATEKLFT